MFIDQFEDIWLIDFEFRVDDGGLPLVICLVAREFLKGQELRVWGDELCCMTHPPFSIGKDVLIVTYYASAEMGCFLELGWSMPENILDLYAEFRNQTNGLYPAHGNGLLGALAWYGLDAMEGLEKERMRALVMRGGDYTTEERQAILDYCYSDVHALAKLLSKMKGCVTPHAFLRGRFMVAAARMEGYGIPIDVPAFKRIKENWTSIQEALITETDLHYGIYEGRTFKRDRFEAWLIRKNIPWPTLESGQMALDDDTFRQMAKVYPEVAPLKELRGVLSQMRLSNLTIGPDGRNRCLLSAFSARTGRNQPSNTKFIFGPAVWLRSLIKPRSGTVLVYIDWSQQEFGIAAALSHDEAMQQGYLSGDPYLEFARMAKAVPADATKASHPSERELFKATALAVQYGMGEQGLARRLNVPLYEAKELLKKHKSVFQRFWTWSDGAVDFACLLNRIYTVFGGNSV